jgi:hypothetical protein
MSVIINPIEQYFDLNGNPLENGYLYFGEVYGNPQTDPVMVYFDPEFTIPAAQPVRTVNGYPVRSGTASGLFAPQDVSITILNSKREQVLYIESSNIITSQDNTFYRLEDVTLTADDNNKTFILLDTFTQTFDAAVNLGNRWRVTLINMSNGNITLDPNLSETIDGLATLQLQPNSSLTVYCDGVNLKTTTSIYPVQSILSASNLDLRASKAKIIEVTGANTVNTVQMINGDRIIAIAGSAFQLTNGASLIVQGNANYTTSAGDILTFAKDQTANNVYVSIARADGMATIPSPIVTQTGDPTLSSNVDTQSPSVAWGNAKFLIKEATAVTTSGAAAYDFTNIPAGVKRITVNLKSVSTNGSSILQIQLGAGAIQTAAYDSTGAACSSSGNALALTSSGFLLSGNNNPAVIHSGVAIISKVSGNTWAMGGVGKQLTTQTCHSGGDVVLTGVLDRLRLTTQNGTDVFDGGTVNITWEY